MVLGAAVGHAQPPAPPSYLSSMEPIHTNAQPAKLAAPESTTLAPAPDQRGEAAPRKPEGTTSAAEPAPAGSVSAIGDSVMLGSAATLTRDVPALDVIDAEVGLQVSAAIDILRWRCGAGQLGDAVVVRLGNNGTFTAEQFDEMMGVLGDERRVVFVNVKVSRPWEGPNNAVISEGVRRHPNAALVDWHSASVGHPEYFVEDGFHLQIEGQRVDAGLIAAQLQAP